MEKDLEKIDLLRERFNLSYKQAKGALDAAEGDVLKALINLEEAVEDGGWSGKFTGQGRKLAGQIKTAWVKTKKSRIKIKKGDDTVLEIPASLGALGVVGALASSELAVIGFLGAATAMARKYTIEVAPKNDQASCNEMQDEPLH